MPLFTEQELRDRATKETDKLNGVFDGGFSGIIYEGKRKSTMPSYIGKLAEQEKDVKEEAQTEEIKDLINKEPTGLTRAEELSSDESRVVESRAKVAVSEQQIEKEVEKLLSRGYDLSDIQDQLTKKFPSAVVQKYLQANSKSNLNKYGQLGYIYLTKNAYSSCDELREELANLKRTGRNLISKLKITKGACNDCTRNCRGNCLHTNLKLVEDPQVSTVKEASTILSKFAKIVGEETITKFAEKLKTENPTTVISSFLASVDNLRREASRKESAFKRDIDQKQLEERIIDNNTKKNATLNRNQLARVIWFDFKSYIQSGIDQKQAHQKIAKQYDYEDVKHFYNRFASEIDVLLKFNDRNTFDTDFGKVAAEARSSFDIENRESYDEKKLLNYAFNLMSNGISLRETKEALKKNFEYKQAKKFIADNEAKLEKHYGQLGHIFIDANIYDSCDVMKKVYNEMNHSGKKLIYCLKAKKACKNCVENKEGSCEKVHLLISNHPLVRSPRAAKRVFAKAEKFVPKSYIDKFTSKISAENNISLVSEFTLGIRNALKQEGKNIGKTAAKLQDSNASQFFVQTEVDAQDLYKKSADSKIIESILSKN